ncbi:hypothetical protein FHX09_004720 [Rhizobium sp. BK538]|nr:hypothetical protein [Rhizobium sp. BK060]MBB4170839.1 hypothetical protein [Rhizobium sp. BK538]
MENLVGWIVIVGALYIFVPSFKRMVNGWIVQLGDKVRQDAELPIKKEAPDEKQVEEIALMMFRMQYPDNPGFRRYLRGSKKCGPIILHDACKGVSSWRRHGRVRRVAEERDQLTFNYATTFRNFSASSLGSWRSS